MLQHECKSRFKISHNASKNSERLFRPANRKNLLPAFLSASSAFIRVSLVLPIPAITGDFGDHGDSFHVFLTLIARIVVGETPNSRAISLMYIRSSASIVLIRLTCSAVNLAEPCL